MVRYGAHLSRRTILEDVAATGAEAAQVFLGSPKSWRRPATLTEKELEFWASYEVPMYVHSSYILNPASSTEGVRLGTIRSLGYQFEAAEAINAEGVVIHAGHAGGDSLETAVERWQHTMEQVDTRGLKLLIENTAGGKSAPGRSLDGLEALWRGLDEWKPELVLDTCHAWAGDILNPELEPEDAFMGLLEELKRRSIPIGLLHLNGSKDARNSGRDHHSNLTDSLFPIEIAKRLAEVSGVDAILETPGPLETLREELAILRA